MKASKTWLALTVIGLAFSAVVTHAHPAQVGNAPPKKTLSNFSFRLKVPVQAGVECTQNAAALANRFSIATKLATQNVTGLCQARQTLTSKTGDYTVDIVVVNYSAEAEQTAYRASLTGAIFDGRVGGSSEPFASYQACSSILATQAASFTEQTGLDAVAAYCEASQYDVTEGFTLNLLGFGKPTVRLYSTLKNLVNADDVAPFTGYVAAAIVNLGGVIAYQDAYRVFYFAKQALDIHIDSFSIFANPMCEDQKSEVNNILLAAGRTNITVLCAPNSYTSISLTAVSAGYGSFDSDLGFNSPQYATYQECQLDRERLVSKTKSQRSDVLGALCTRSETGRNQFVLQFYTKR